MGWSGCIDSAVAADELTPVEKEVEDMEVEDMEVEGDFRNPMIVSIFV